MNPKYFLNRRPRRNRKSETIRNLCEETKLAPQNFILPVFVTGQAGKQKTAIPSMPGVFRHSLESLLFEVEESFSLGLKSFSIFPVIEDSLKNSNATESANPKNLLCQTLREIKKRFPESVLMSDVAMDPYSSDGHDGLVKDGKIVNDETLSILCEMAVVQAEAGADLLGPSDMMDGRVGFLRAALDSKGFEETSILSYSAKYASQFYGPFRDALDSAPRFGDKKTYQMNPANRREALLEAQLDFEEGADMLMVKPALSYLDIISDLSQNFDIPVAAYHVSGEYAMIHAAAEKGWLKLEPTMMESLISIRRAGAQVILSYFAKRACELLQKK